MSHSSRVMPRKAKAYFSSARNASELGAGLTWAMATPGELPEGRLSIQATKDGELTDALVVVTQAETGDAQRCTQ